MPVPKSVIRFKKDNVVVTSSVDRVNYTMRELTRAALRDVGKYVSRLCNSAAATFAKGYLRRHGYRRIRGKTSAFQYWARAKECDLQVGIKHNTWYGVQQELGERGQPHRGTLRNVVYNHIPEIVKIESQYLSSLEDEAKALEIAQSHEEDYQGGDEE